MRNIPTIALVFACSMAAAAQSTLTGTWQGQTTAGTSLTLDLTLKDTVRTGTLTRADETTPISEGKITKDTFTFKATLKGDELSASGSNARGRRVRSR